MTAHLLAPVDLVHETSWAKALPQAFVLARAMDAQVTVMTVVPEVVGGLSTGATPSAARPAARRRSTSRVSSRRRSSGSSASAATRRPRAPPSRRWRATAWSTRRS